MHRGIATFTLDYGTCPPWLFRRMVQLGRAMLEVMVDMFGPDEVVRRLADPVWFQALGTVLAFDWNASGLTTILTAALKEAIREREIELGLFICGGKGKTSRKTPDEITNWGDRLALPDPSVANLVYNSKMSAKVDSALVQDGFQIYHHCFIFSRTGAWTVIQQGMNTALQTARRYHWHSLHVHDLVCEPHAAIISPATLDSMLDLTAKKSTPSREASVSLVKDGFSSLMHEVTILRKHASSLSQMISVKKDTEQLTLLNLENTEFTTHLVINENFGKSAYLEKILSKLCEETPSDYATLLATQGVGPKTVRALALVAEMVYGAKPSYEDPARYSFAHGGKDATPFPIDYDTYDQTISLMQEVIKRAKLTPGDKTKAHEKLKNSVSPILKPATT